MCQSNRLWDPERWTNIKTVIKLKCLNYLKCLITTISDNDEIKIWFSSIDLQTTHSRIPLSKKLENNELSIQLVLLQGVRTDLKEDCRVYETYPMGSNKQWSDWRTQILNWLIFGLLPSSSSKITVNNFEMVWNFSMRKILYIMGQKSVFLL